MMSALETLRAFSRNAALSGDEKNEINERTPQQIDKKAILGGAAIDGDYERSSQTSSEGGARGLLSYGAPSGERAKSDAESDTSVVNSFNSFFSSPGSADDLDIIEEGAGVPKRWAEGFAAMCSIPAPTGFSPERWRRIIDATGTFLDEWAAKAIACGWTDLDVFGCDAAAPDRRFDCMGIALVDRWEVVGIDEGGADLMTETGARLRYYRRSLPTNTVRLWDLVTTGRGRDAG
jgi:hypothetical protein